MTRSTTARRLSAWLGVVLVAALLPLLGPLAPAAHAAECTSEEAPTMDPFPIPTGPGCDDITPPETTIVSTTPAPNDNGFIAANSVTFTFSGSHTDGDADPVAFECQFFNTATPPIEWTTCTSPVTHDELAETAAAPYTFRVRAVDTADRGIDLTADPFFPSETDAPDEDQTPAQAKVSVDTIVPVAQLFKGPYDSEGTGFPVATQPRVTYLVKSLEDNVDFRCRMDGAPVGCKSGLNTYRGLSGGPHVFDVTVTDRAGNRDATPATKQFLVPYNLTRGTDWKKRKGRGYFANDYLQTRQRGAITTFRARNVREVLLIAPSGDGLGKIRVRVGSGPAQTFNLGRKRDAKRRTYEVRGPGAPLVSGKVTIQSLSRKVVRVDALVFPDGS